MLFAQMTPASNLLFMIFFFLCSGLVAVHLLVVSFAPPFADGLIYGFWALSLFVYAGVVFVQVRFASGMLSFRWSLFALSLLFYGANNLHAMIHELFKLQVPQLDSILLAIGGTLVFLAITLPLGERIAWLDRLDTAVALVFCAFRLLHLLDRYSQRVAVSSVLAHYTFDSVIRLALVLIAFSVSTRGLKKFYRNITLYLVADLLATFCIDQIGYLWLGQHTASPWTLSGTLVPIACSVFLLGSLTEGQSQALIDRGESSKPILRTLLPFSMTLLIVFFTIMLVPIHPYLAKLGMAFAVLAFFTRVILIARHRDMV